MSDERILAYRRMRWEWPLTVSPHSCKGAHSTSADCCQWQCSPTAVSSWCQIAADDRTTHSVSLLAGMLALLTDMQAHHPAGRHLLHQLHWPSYCPVCSVCRPRCFCYWSISIMSKRVGKTVTSAACACVCTCGQYEFLCPPPTATLDISIYSLKYINQDHLSHILSVICYKLHACYYCQKLVKHMAPLWNCSHMQNKGTENCFTCWKSQAEGRADEISKLRLLGDYYHNIKVLSQKVESLLL